MKILFVTSEIPYPPDNGVRIVSHHAMRLMYEAGHKLALAVLSDEAETPETRLQWLSKFCVGGMSWWMPLPRRSQLRIQFAALSSRRLFFIERYRNQSFREKLALMIEKFNPDVIHFDIITMTQYRDLAPPGVGAIASINDSYALAMDNLLTAGNYKGLERLYREVQLHQSRRYEATAYPKFDAVHVMTEVDAAYLRALNPATHTSVISNGVDPSLFEITSQTRNRQDVIYVAKLVGENVSYLKSLLEHSWPIIHRSCPEIRLHIVGKVGPEVQAVKHRADGKDGVVFHGYVNRLADAYQKCGIAVVPINKNCGLINKAIEAMAAGLAVVGFEKTFTGVKYARNGVHFDTARDYEDLGCTVVKLIEDAHHRHAVQTAAHKLASKHYSWVSRGRAYEQMYGLAASTQNNSE